MTIGGWRFGSSARRGGRAAATLPEGPVLGPNEGYLGRVVIEVWTPDRAGDDGIRYLTQLAHGGGAEPGPFDDFARQTVGTLAARIARQGRLR